MIRFEERKELKTKPAKDAELGFGRIFTDYMILADYTPEEGWHDVEQFLTDLLTTIPEQ